MLCRKGFTLMELLVVLFIVGITACLCFPNFYGSTQRAYSQAAKNNLLAIYSAQLNYFNNNNGVYCLNAPCGGSLFDLNANLNLDILCSDTPCQASSTDPGGYNYSCSATGAPLTCTAINSNTTLTIDNNGPVVLKNGTLNPRCSGTYCPY